ncbi:hypothetical protein IJI72_01945 [Candidatus Saccharibacteria bacterium]|nr:hypothetical protein [Candidatus Saccharibacteria bacterium]
MKGHRGFLSRFFLLFLAFFLSLFLPASPAFATFSDLRIDYFAQNNIFMYSDDEWCNPTGANINNIAGGKPSGDQVTWIGDSYSVGAVQQIQDKLPGVDLGPGEINTSSSYIQISKWPTGSIASNPTGTTLVKQIVSENKLRPYLVFALGTNNNTDGGEDSVRSIMKSAVDEVLSLTESLNTKIIFVTAYTTQANAYAKANELLKETATGNDRVFVADWAAVAKDEYYSDGTHPANNGGYDAWVNCIYDALPGSTSGAISGSTNEEKIWNYFLSAGISGVSDNPAVIAGIVGNIAAESDYDPFVTTNSGSNKVYGLTQVNGSFYPDFLEAMENAGLSQYWDKTEVDSTATDAAIKIQLDYLTQKLDRWTGTGNGDWTKNFAFSTHLDTPTNKTPSSYAELFAVSIEGAVTSDSSQAILDDGVRRLGTNNFSSASGGGAYYQGIAIRRQNAEDLYKKYSNSSASTTSSSTTTATTTTSSTSNTSSTSSNSSSLSLNLPQETITQLESANVKGLAEKNMERYRYGQEKTGVPWQALAALHWREAGMGSNQSISNGEELYDHINVDGVHVGADPNQDAVDAGNHLKELAKTVYDISSEPSSWTLDDWGNAFLAYNRGTMYKARGNTWQESPYVAAGMDSEHPIGMTWIYADSYTPDGTQVNSVYGKKNGVVGALATMSYLGGTLTGSSSSTVLCSSSSGNGGGSIIETARRLGWTDDSHFNEVKPEFISAAQALGGGSRSYCSGKSSDLDYSQDCGIYVSVVVRTSGVDPNFPAVGTYEMEPYMKSSTLWQEIPNLGNESNLQPGDIMVYNYNGGSGGNGHIMIYNGNGTVCQASLCNQTGWCGRAIYYESQGVKYSIFRSTANANSSPQGTTGSFDGDLKALETGSTQVGAAVTAPGNTDASKVVVGGSYTGARAWSTIKVPLAIAAIQKNASTGSVTEPYGTSCSGPLSTAVQTAITRSDNCGAWWLWQALGGDNSSAAATVTDILRAGKDTTTSVNGTGDGTSLTSGKTNWSLVNQALFAANMPPINGASTVMTHMKNQSGDDSTHGLNTWSSSMSKGGWGSDATRQFGIIKLSSGKCSAIAIGTNVASDFNVLDKIAEKIKAHESELPSGTCPTGL